MLDIYSRNTKKQIPYKNQIEFGEDYIVESKTSQIQFNKSDFRHYLMKYLDKFNADYDVSRYLAEVIILSRLMKHYMIDKGDEFYEEIIS